MAQIQKKYPNLNAELARQGLTQDQMAERIGRTRGMVIDAMVHVQGIGDVWVEGIGHEGGTIGTVGESRRVEGIAIRVVSGGRLQYRCHIQRKGWTPWVDDGNYCGTRGERLRVEAVQIRFA